MIQLYTKDIDGTYEKIDGRLLKFRSKEQIEEAIKKATLGKTNSYNNTDFEGFIDEELLRKELKIGAISKCTCGHLVSQHYMYTKLQGKCHMPNCDCKKYKKVKI